MSQHGGFRIDNQLLAESDALLAAIVRSATDAIIAVNAEGMVVSWNRGAQLHFGYPEREMIGLPVNRFIPPDRLKEQETALRRVFAGELVGSFHSIRTTRNGRDMAVSVSMSPIHDAGGLVVAASAIVRPRMNARRRHATPDQGNLWSALASESEEQDLDADALIGRQILVVEDETLVGLGLASMLENAGFDVIGPVGDLRTAMALLDERSCALAILDINLAHGETSAPLAERLKRSGIPFLVTSGNLNLERPGVFGSAPSLPKPVGARALVAAVQEALG
jgi:PAS domain S-box-containing protein